MDGVGEFFDKLGQNIGPSVFQIIFKSFPGQVLITICIILLILYLLTKIRKVGK